MTECGQKHNSWIAADPSPVPPIPGIEVGGYCSCRDKKLHVAMDADRAGVQVLSNSDLVGSLKSEVEDDVFVGAYVYGFVSMYAFLHVCIFVYVPLNRKVSTYIHTYVFMYVCAHVRRYICA